MRRNRKRERKRGLGEGKSEVESNLRSDGKWGEREKADEVTMPEVV